MKINNLKVNYMNHPVGISLNYLLIQWEIIDTDASTMKEIEITISKDDIVIEKKVLSDTNVASIKLEENLDELTQYHYQVKAKDDQGNEASETSYFITPKKGEWEADFITPATDKNIILKYFHINKQVKQAYLSICGLGLYEAYLNDEFVNHEYLMPGYHSYDTHLQYQTYDLKEYLHQGDNTLMVLLGNGWYKGRLIFEGGFYNLYGDKLALIFEIKLEYTDGTIEIIKSDKACKSMQSNILTDNGIYDGETIDMKIQDSQEYKVEDIDIDKSLLTPRYSLPITIQERIKPIQLITSPKGEHILDFGQNLTGWIEFKAKSDVYIQFGEILQDGCFYNDNYRIATFGFKYISDGKERVVRPHFTFYGFRYAKIETEDEIDINNFEACLITSEMDDTGFIETGNQKVNQLLSNVRYSQKDNFLDVPTDCPQRDERLGWTGDAQIFANTAMFNMNAIQFYRKFLHDMLCEQELDHGRVGNVIPSPKPKIENYADKNNLELGNHTITMFSIKNCMPWSDAATIIPWNVYQFSGDKDLLKETYPNMKMYVDSAIEMDKSTGTPYLLDSGFHFADWLALDAKPGEPLGATDMHYVASVFYYYSTTLVARAAKVLGLEEEEYYNHHASLIRQAIREKYMDHGMINVDTQTAYVLAIYFQILEEDEIQQNVDRLAAKIHENNNKLQTGFVGTPYLNFVLSQNGYTDLAYDLLLNEEYPGWLYEVNLGATTIWERWNSVMEDGSMNPEGMNSLNHYAYGSIAEWIYREVCGLNPLVPGFKKVLIKPKPDKRLGYCKCSYQSVNGLYKVQWNISDDILDLSVDIPFGCVALLCLPIMNEEIELSHGHYEYKINMK